MQTLEQYFSQGGNVPAAGSRVGILMAKVIEKYPGIELEEARAKANTLLLQAAGRKKYVLPAVLSEQELADQKEQVRAAFQKPTQQLSLDDLLEPATSAL